MRSFVEILPEARSQLLQLLQQRTRSRMDALAASIIYCEEVIRVFEINSAPPSGSVLRPPVEGSVWWWLFADGIWLAFTREDRLVGRWPFRRRIERIVRIVGAATRPIPV